MNLQLRLGCFWMGSCLTAHCGCAPIAVLLITIWWYIATPTQHLPSSYLTAIHLRPACWLFFKSGVCVIFMNSYLAVHHNTYPAPTQQLSGRYPAAPCPLAFFQKRLVCHCKKAPGCALARWLFSKATYVPLQKRIPIGTRLIYARPLLGSSPIVNWNMILSCSAQYLL